MPWNGNMKPDSIICGSSENCASCCACCCVRASVENVMPSARLPAMNTPSAASSTSSEPRIGTWNASAETRR